MYEHTILSIKVCAFCRFNAVSLYSGTFLHFYGKEKPPEKTRGRNPERNETRYGKQSNSDDEIINHYSIPSYREEARSTECVQRIPSTQYNHTVNTFPDIRSGQSLGLQQHFIEDIGDV